MSDLRDGIVVRSRRDLVPSSSALINLVLFCVEALCQHLAYLWVGGALGGVVRQRCTAVLIGLFYAVSVRVGLGPSE